MAELTLTGDEIALARSAFESTEYWENRDFLDHDSGYITDPTQREDGVWVDVNDEPLDELSLDAWEQVRDLRALDAKFALAQR